MLVKDTKKNSKKAIHNEKKRSEDRYSMTISIDTEKYLIKIIGSHFVPRVVRNSLCT